MEKVITIDGRQVTFKSTGAFLLRYKAQFKRDAIQDIFKLIDALGNTKAKDLKKLKQLREGGEDNAQEIEEIIKSLKGVNLDALDLEVFFNLIWTLAKTADPTIPPPMEWLDSFSEFPLLDIIPEVFDMVTSCLGSTVPSKKK